MAASYLPPGWPEQVRPPGNADFERTAVNWLLDHCPPDFREYALLRRHPVLLARLAREQLGAAVEACRAGYRTARADLRDTEPAVVDELLGVYEREGRRLAAAVRAAELVASGLRGEVFTRPL
jgi:hypothetical protein